MKIYLAARVGRQAELKSYRDTLERIGHKVTSTWLDEDLTVEQDRTAEARLEVCLRDLIDLGNADCLISFTEDPNTSLGKRGGRHVEFGIALQAGKKLIVVGYRENVFHFHPKVEFYVDANVMLWDLIMPIMETLSNLDTF